MKKSILNLGKQLNKTEQKTINGGTACGAPGFYSGRYVCECPGWSLVLNGPRCVYTDYFY